MKMFLILILSSLNAFAHGEDKPGPHGGHIRMPSAFHTEVVVDNDTSLRVYLLDLQFQNPIIEKSKVSVSLVGPRKGIKFDCPAMVDHFHCTSKTPFTGGKLSVRATRSGISAPKPAVYKLPLKPFAPAATSAPAAPAVDHSNHH